MNGKIFFAVVVSSLLAAPAAFASHPHQAICAVKAKYANGDSLQFLLQTESAREYVYGDPNQDIHDYRYQIRVCDDDNDAASCSTYESKSLSHGPSDLVTLVGMKNKEAVFFEGRFTAKGEMEGKIVQTAWKGEQKVRNLVPFKIKLQGCLSQSWVELKPEADSNSY